MNIGDCDNREKFLRFLNQPTEAMGIIEFKEIVQKAVDLGITPAIIGHAVSQRKYTIGRWQRGEIVPHVTMQRTTIDELKKLLASVPA